jgi:hypothetical protein
VHETATPVREDTEAMMKSHATRTKCPLICVLVPAIQNEGMFIEGLLRFVVSPTVLLFKWVIVSDGSTNATETIVQGFTSDIH